LPGFPGVPGPIGLKGTPGKPGVDGNRGNQVSNLKYNLILMRNIELNMFAIWRYASRK